MHMLVCGTATCWMEPLLGSTASHQAMFLVRTIGAQWLDVFDFSRPKERALQQVQGRLLCSRTAPTTFSVGMQTCPLSGNGVSENPRGFVLLEISVSYPGSTHAGTCELFRLGAHRAPQGPQINHRQALTVAAERVELRNAAHLGHGHAFGARYEPPRIGTALSPISPSK